jgi:hypothetical protein
MTVHSFSLAPALVNVMERPCSNACCGGVLHYDGAEHSITVMNKTRDGNFVAIDTELLLNIVNGMKKSQTTLSQEVENLNERYRNRGIELQIPKATFLRGIWSCIKHLMVPYINESLCICEACGPIPDTIVGDGITIGVRFLKSMRRFFNELKNQGRSPKMRATERMYSSCNGVFADTMGRLLILCKDFADLAGFSGKLHGIGVQVHCFATGNI